MDQPINEIRVEEESERMEVIDLPSVPLPAPNSLLDLQGEEGLKADRKIGGAAGTRRRLCSAEKKRRCKIKAELAARDGSSASVVGTVPEVISSFTKIAGALGKRKPNTNETPPSEDRVRKKPKGPTGGQEAQSVPPK